MPEALNRERVIATARAAVEANGAESLSLRAVARELGVTAPALYAYVSDKQDLVSAIAAEYFDELAARFAKVDDPDPVQRMRALARAYVDHATAEPHLFHLMFRYPPDMGVPVDGVESFAPATRAFELAAAATDEARVAGLIDVPDTLTACLSMWAAMHGAAEVLLLGFDFDETTANALVDTVIETMLRGQGVRP